MSLSISMTTLMGCSWMAYKRLVWISALTTTVYGRARRRGTGSTLSASSNVRSSFFLLRVKASAESTAGSFLMGGCNLDRSIEDVWRWNAAMSDQMLPIRSTSLLRSRSAKLQHLKAYRFKFTRVTRTTEKSIGQEHLPRIHGEGEGSADGYAFFLTFHRGTG